MTDSNTDSTERDVDPTQSGSNPSDSAEKSGGNELFEQIGAEGPSTQSQTIPDSASPLTSTLADNPVDPALPAEKKPEKITSVGGAIDPFILTPTISSAKTNSDAPISVDFIHDTDGNREPESANEDASVRPKKRNSKMNALTHGAYARDYVLAWEDQAEFEGLHNSFKEEWKPRGATEEGCVLSLTHWHWKRQRVVQLAQIRFAQSPLSGELKDGEINWDEMVRKQSESGSALNGAAIQTASVIISLNRLSKKITEQTLALGTSKDTATQLNTLRTAVQKITQEVDKNVIENLREIRKRVQTVPAPLTAYDPTELETQTKLLSMIDREIDKTVRRLMLLHTFKSMEPQRTRNMSLQPSSSALLEAPPTAPEQDNEPAQAMEHAVHNKKT